MAIEFCDFFLTELDVQCKFMAKFGIFFLFVSLKKMTARKLTQNEICKLNGIFTFHVK